MVRPWFSIVTAALIAAFCLAPGNAVSLHSVRKAGVRAGHKKQGKTTDDKLSLGDIAIGFVSGRKTYWESLHKAVLQFAPKAVLLEAPGKCDCGFRAGFQALYDAEPTAKWYYVGDEDAFLYLDYLTELLSKRNASKPIVMANLGNHPGAYEAVCHGKKSPIPDTHLKGTNGHLTFFGGTGIIVSQAMMKQINFAEKCHHNAKAADRDVTCLIGSSWKPDFTFIKLDGQKGEDEEDYPRQLSYLQVIQKYGILHHLSAENITNKAHMNAHLEGNHTFRKVALWENHGCKAK